jgi:hypothetical protein
VDRPEAGIAIIPIRVRSRSEFILIPLCIIAPMILFPGYQMITGYYAVLLYSSFWIARNYERLEETRVIQEEARDRAAARV